MPKPQLVSPQPEPVHGYCAICEGPIERGMQWTFTRQMNRIHNDPDRCIEVLHPEIVNTFLRTNPRYEWPNYK